MRSDIVPGATSADYELPDHTKTPRRLSALIRPDWDLGRPGLRAAWDAGDRSPFHGWDRRAGRYLPRTRHGSTGVDP